MSLNNRRQAFGEIVLEFCQTLIVAEVAAQTQNVNVWVALNQIREIEEQNRTQNPTP